MEKQQPIQKLSQEAINEFKAIYQEEFGAQLTDSEAEEAALRLLRFMGIMETGQKPVEPQIIKVTNEEFDALKYIHISLYHDHKQPTVRGIAATLGRRSSRTGQRMLDNLITKGWVYRDYGEGKIRMPEHLARCGTGLH